MPFQTTTTAAPAPVVGRARAALLVLEHAERTGLPMPFDVSVQDYSPAIGMLFRSVADLAEWALWLETQVVERRAADVVAAGAVVFRPGREVLLVHRQKYDDWSFPKGKLDPREHPTTAAVREVAEETGLHVRLGPPLATMRYPNNGRMKTVHYWQGRAVGDDDVSAYEPSVCRVYTLQKVFFAASSTALGLSTSNSPAGKKG